MRNWFPFTDYDFYGYLASGFVLLFAADYTFTGGALMLREHWTFVQIVLAVSVAYFAGQIAASPSSVVLEHWLGRRVLRPPAVLLLGLVAPRPVDRFLACWVVGRYYEPLPAPTRAAILSNAGVTGESLDDAEAVFQKAFPVARRHEDTRRRMDDFRNQYGLNRNMSFTALIACVLLLGRAAGDGDDTALLLVALSLLLAVGLYARFLKFYAAFAAEVLRAYAHAGPDKGGASAD